jgi:hypothetical protein
LASSRGTKPTHQHTPCIHWHTVSTEGPPTHHSRTPFHTHSLPVLPPSSGSPSAEPNDLFPFPFYLSCGVRPRPPLVTHHSFTFSLNNHLSLLLISPVPSPFPPSSTTHTPPAHRTRTRTRTRTHPSGLPHLSTPAPPALSPPFSLSLYRLPIQQPLSLSSPLRTRAFSLYSLSLPCHHPGSGLTHLVARLRKRSSRHCCRSCINFSHLRRPPIYPTTVQAIACLCEPSCPSTIDKNLHQIASARSKYTYCVGRHASSDTRTIEDPIDGLSHVAIPRPKGASSPSS